MPAQIRKIIVQVDETRLEMGRAVNPPTRRALAMAVIANPYAGRFSQTLDALVDDSPLLGEEFGRRIQALAGSRQIESYGKAILVGSAGEYEHGEVRALPGPVEEDRRRGAESHGWQGKSCGRKPDGCAKTGSVIHSIAMKKGRSFQTALSFVPPE